MNNNDEMDDDLLKGAWSSRRFIHPEKSDKSPGELSKKTTLKASSEKNKKRISSSIKYGKTKSDTTGYKPLSVSDQIRIAAGFKQAVIKITSYGKGSSHIMNHLSYISRNFDIALEDNNESLLKTRQDAKDILESWESMYFDNRKNSRDTLNLVFSAPPGTNRDTFNTLTREFLNEEFEGEHDYLFAQHDDTDHPHIHSVIVLRSIDGKKLDPRKQYINQLRKRYAEKCREHGVMVEASRRFERGIAGKSTRFEMVQMRNKKQVTPAADDTLLRVVKEEMQSGRPSVDTGCAIRQVRNKQVRELFYTTAKSLRDGYLSAPDGTKKDNDLKASELLFNYANGMPNEMTRADYLKLLVNNKSLKKRGKGAHIRGQGLVVPDQKIKDIDPEIN